MQQKISGQFFPEMYIVTQRCGDDTEYVFELLSKSHTAICPCCGTESRRQHDYQDRRIRDLPILGKPVTLLIAQMKYYCGNNDCDVNIFTERNELVSQYSQFTERCREYMLKVATLVSCESAVKILAYQGVRVCGDTLLNMLKAAGRKHVVKVGTRIGIDDWAYRKGQKYGTLICDLETHEIIDVLEGRDGETLEKWLKGNPDIEIVSRDRASAYSSAVSNVLPEAVQIADRFHITKNLLEALNNTMKAFMPEVVIVPTEEPAKPEMAQANEAVKKTQRRRIVKNPK
jgi:transposase